jgi:tetratricopeptide (TPR) repeat protein
MSYEAIAIGRKVGDRPLLAQSLNVLGELARNQGDDDLAERCYVEGLALAEEAGDQAHRCVFLANQAYLAMHRGDYDEALRLTRESLDTSWSLGLRMVTAWTLSEMAGPRLGLGQPQLAAVLVGAADHALDTLGVGRQLGDEGEYEAVVRSLRETLGGEAFDLHAADGARLTLSEAVRLALRDHEGASISGAVTH